jgi:hypothetical protein
VTDTPTHEGEPHRNPRRQKRYQATLSGHDNRSTIPETALYIPLHDRKKDGVDVVADTLNAITSTAAVTLLRLEERFFGTKCNKA